MARVYYVGDWAVQLGQLYAETSFNHAPTILRFFGLETTEDMLGRDLATPHEHGTRLYDLGMVGPATDVKP